MSRKTVGKVIGLALQIIGFAGIPKNVSRWVYGLSFLDSSVSRTLLVLLGLFILIGSSLDWMKRTKPTQLNAAAEWLGRGVPVWLVCVFLLATGIVIGTRRDLAADLEKTNPLIEGSQFIYKYDMEPRYQTIIGKAFANTVVPLDGKKYLQCKFNNVTFNYDGLANFIVENPTSSTQGFIKIHTNNVALYNQFKIIKAVGALKDGFTLEPPEIVR